MVPAVTTITLTSLIFISAMYDDNQDCVTIYHNNPTYNTAMIPCAYSSVMASKLLEALVETFDRLSIILAVRHVLENFYHLLRADKRSSTSMLHT